jgi:Flp pilus assembly protein TadG
MKQALARPRRGQNLVELALVLPFSLWLLLGIVDFGRVYFFHVAATNAAREGARYWASNLSASDTTIKARVQAEAAPQVTLDDDDITLSNPTWDQCEVQVQYEFTAITPLVATLWGGGPATLTTQAVMPVLQAS